MSDIRSTPPLEGVRVLAFEQFGAGPWATLQLADLGADVIKVEDPASGGDVSRYVPPFQEGEDSLFFETFNRGKRSISLDLRQPDAQEVLHDLVANVHAVFCNLRGDQPGRLGLTYDALREHNAAIVCCSLSGFGMSGPRASQPAYDYIIQGMAGWMSLTGEPSGPPTKSGLSLVDLSGGYAAAVALLGGLWRARRDGVGCQCDISLFETALSLLTYTGTWTLSRDYHAERLAESAHPSIVPFQVFATKDGWITVACAKQKFWVLLCECIEREDLLDDPHFADFSSRRAHRAELMDQLRPLFVSRTTSEWLDRLGPAGVPSGAVNDVEDAMADDQVIARGAVAEVDHPRLGTVRHVASPLRLGTKAPSVSLAPQRGSDTVEILTSLCGYADEKIVRLERSSVFGAFDKAAPDASVSSSSGQLGGHNREKVGEDYGHSVGAH